MNSLIPNNTITPEQVGLIKRTIFKDATDDELSLFIHVAQRSGLDPFARQIYAVKRQGKMTIQTSIDGFRLIASRTDAYAGRDEAIFEYDEKTNRPSKCKVTVYKIVQGMRCAFTSTAKWDEYYPGEQSGFMWRKLPETMLEKCCESKALRMAFPAELSALYTDIEMEQAGVPPNIRRDEPGEEDGLIDHTVIPFGKFAGKKCEEVPLDDLRGYAEYLMKKELEPKFSANQRETLDFISSYLASLENLAGDPAL